jgi:putative two-component system response regulator
MPDHLVKSAQFLIVDGQDTHVRRLRDILSRAGAANITATADERRAAALFDAIRPDIVLLDLMTPAGSGLALLAQIRAMTSDGEFCPVLVMGAAIDTQTKQRALAEGASDFLAKPADPIELMLRVRNLLRTRSLARQLLEQNERLDRAVQERTRDVEEARVEILERLALAAEFRDDDTGQHTIRVGELSARLARVLDLSREEIDLLRRAAPLHDVGKIGIPDVILLKPAALTPVEFEIMKTHTTIGAKILSGSRSPLLQAAQSIALTHHERWRGQGYPHGLQGSSIPTVSRIVAVADVYDAMTNDRPYRRAFDDDKARRLIRESANLDWDEAIVQALDTLAARGALTHLERPLAVPAVAQGIGLGASTPDAPTG